MTVSDLVFFNSLADSVATALDRIQTAQLQVATGLRVRAPSDDPAAFATATGVQASKSAAQNEVSLAGQIQARLTLTDSALAEATQALTAALEAATQGADGTITPAQMAAIADRAQGLLDGLLGNANLKYAGAYVFGGNQTLDAPFDASGTYLGDGGSNSATFTGGTKARLTFDGSAVFGDATSGAIGALSSLVSSLQSGNKPGVAATLPLLNDALQGLSETRASVGSTINGIRSLAENSRAIVAVFEGNLSDLVGADIARTAIELQQAQLQQQALISLASSAGRIPLVNVLA